MTRIALAWLALALSAAHALALSGPQVKVVLDAGPSSFEYRTELSSGEALRLASPSPADLKPYVERAQRALAVKMGYSERIYGARHHTLAENRLVEITVLDRASRVVHRYRPRVRRTAAR